METRGPGRIRSGDMEYLIYEDVVVTRGNAPRYTLNGEVIDIWSEPYKFYHSKTPTDYAVEKILESEREDIDIFPSVVGKQKEKELVKNALLSSSPILFKGKRGYGKTTFSKAIAELLPSKILAIKGCKIHDDPTRPSCFSCKKKIFENNSVELVWVPRVWVRIPGDPMLTTRQLVGGISIQKIREGYDLDHPEVFIPGRALKANRGVGYFDELGAVPSSLQTLLHEFLEEHQVTTMEGDIVPFKIQTLELASTNPANYRGTCPIKEPLLDRMEEVEMGPPETLEEEIEIGLRNMYLTRREGKKPNIPYWHLRILARTVRYARDRAKHEVARRIESEPSCRATIKLYDHVQSKAIRQGREVPLLADYGESSEIVKLALVGRIEVEYGYTDKKAEVVERLLDEALNETCKEVYDQLPSDRFNEFYRELRGRGTDVDGGTYVPIELSIVQKLRMHEVVNSFVSKVSGVERTGDDLYLSTVDIILKSMTVCTPRYVERKDNGYVLREMNSLETEM